MPKSLTFLVIGLVFGGGLGFLIAASTSHGAFDHGATVHDHAAHDHGDGGHEGHGKMTDVSDNPPTLRIVLHPDGAQSRNLEIITTNFEFDPIGVNGAHAPGKGHAHVYVNNVKITRAYGRWLQLSALPKGEHTVRVTLNANNHSLLMADGTAIEALETLKIE